MSRDRGARPGGRVIRSGSGWSHSIAARVLHLARVLPKSTSIPLTSLAVVLGVDAHRQVWLIVFDKRWQWLRLRCVHLRCCGKAPARSDIRDGIRWRRRLSWELGRRLANNLAAGMPF